MEFKGGINHTIEIIVIPHVLKEIEKITIRYKDKPHKKGECYTHGLEYIFYPIKGGIMPEINKKIAALFPNTEDAILVAKHFGSALSAHDLFYVLVKGKEKEVVAEAHKREDEKKKID